MFINGIVLLSFMFLVLSLLCLLTLGIGFFWLFSYMKVILAKFYDDIKDGNIIIEENYQQ